MNIRLKVITNKHYWMQDLECAQYNNESNEEIAERIIKQIKKAYDLEKNYVSQHNVSNNEVAVCPDWIHVERRNKNDDNFCPICGTDIRQTDC